MDSNKGSTQVERFEVVETGRRRRWTDDEKLKIVLESLQTPRSVSSTARRYGISRSLLLTWRRSFGAQASGDEEPQPSFVPAMVMPDQPPAQPTALATSASGRIEIVSARAYRVIVDAGVDMTALSRVLDLLERR
ncbi:MULTISPECIES: IS66-like element accessory protein TnpA [Bradyrhizobium]|jgi:transposase|uniref:IS66-like element accessory protein TnpA n=1 Tax=Bradyrhizobium TaxID=374 RepID=UPI00056DA759|nr:transposase [Bradyrhizobium elkanii]MCP1972956.1 transposase [Bradyrhizobium elkanii]MCP1974280.1 transposase [Bradyrhizobium elkanii]MCS3520151.1 transposase [Bradyrhizobium elkanii]MCS4067806.1 transposase [Bradyrhizobium elkanii]MCS4083342.1 transposase [Bradyrhizobium elkanii]